MIICKATHNRLKNSLYTLLAIASLFFPPASLAGPIDLALNTSRTGFPSPLESDNGWGGGTDKWEIVDGILGYPDTWAHGLAFTGGHFSSAGGPPWIEPAGVRQATIDFGQPETFDTVVIWHHGVEWTARDPWLDYWDGSVWVRISVATHIYPAGHADGAGYADAEYFGFLPVTGDKVRYSMDNSQYNVLGTYNIHGWINEFEVFNNAPEPTTALLLGSALLVLPLRRRLASRSTCLRDVAPMIVRRREK